jgi:biopolymer transport protein ExbD
MKHLKNLAIIGIAVLAVLTGGCTTTSSPSTSTTDQAQEIAIRIEAGNALYIEDQPCPPGDLIARLAQFVRLQPTNVVIHGANVDNSIVTFVTDACQKAGVHSISFSLVRF